MTTPATRHIPRSLIQLLHEEHGSGTVEQGLILAIVATGAAAFGSQVSASIAGWFGSLLAHAPALWPQ